MTSFVTSLLQRLHTTMADYEPLVNTSPTFKSGKTTPKTPRSKSLPPSPVINGMTTLVTSVNDLTLPVLDEDAGLHTLVDPVASPSQDQVILPPERAEVMDTLEGTACVICFEKTDKVSTKASTMCPQCPYTTCVSCMSSYIATKVEDAIGFVPPIHCPIPSCKAYIPFRMWKDTAGIVKHTYSIKANSLVTIRCFVCDQTRDLLPPSVDDTEVRCKKGGDLMKRLRQRIGAPLTKNLAQVCKKYSAGESTAKEVVDVVDEIAYVLNRHPAGAVDTALMNASAHALVTDMLPLIMDPERRCTLYLCYVRRHPTIEMECCNVKMCFKCQAHEHPGEKCYGFVSSDIEGDPEQIRFCPTCHVAIMRTEGCNALICICGEEMCFDCGNDISECECY